MATVRRRTERRASPTPPARPHRPPAPRWREKPLDTPRTAKWPRHDARRTPERPNRPGHATAPTRRRPSRRRRERQLTLRGGRLATPPPATHRPAPRDPRRITSAAPPDPAGGRTGRE